MLPSRTCHIKKKRKLKKIRTVPLSNPAGKKLIDQREAAVDGRLAFGHWEMDTVYSGKNRGKGCLLVLTERATRKEIIIKMPDRTAASTVAAIDRLERKLGRKTFKAMFQSITCDNGVEFSDIFGIMKRNRTDVFHCHAYASWERGSNENQNKLIRRFIKKGDNISKYTKKQIQDIEDWINMLPRKLFAGRSSFEMFEQALSQLNIQTAQ